MYRWIDHTSEVELEIRAPTERDVLSDALEALAELLGIGSLEARRFRPAERTLLVSAADRPALLAAWLEELVFLAESEGFVATRIDDVETSSEQLRASVAGVLDDPPPLVKGVTYHRLTFESANDGYVARVVLDV